MYLINVFGRYTNNSTSSEGRGPLHVVEQNVSKYSKEKKQNTGKGINRINKREIFFFYT